MVEYGEHHGFLILRGNARDFYNFYWIMLIFLRGNRLFVFIIFIKYHNDNINLIHWISLNNKIDCFFILQFKVINVS